jgi:hypothetical protein
VRETDVADETGWPLSPRSPSHVNPAIPESKRDKKRREITERLTSLNTEFLLSREQHFRATLQKLQQELSQLHDGGNKEFLDRVEILEDARDKELVQIEAGRGYAVLRAEREYQDEMNRAEEEYIVPPFFPLLHVLPLHTIMCGHCTLLYAVECAEN